MYIHIDIEFNTFFKYSIFILKYQI